MNITNECVKCIVSQIDKANKLLKLDEKLSNEIMEEVNKKARNFSFNDSPPFVAKEVYEYLGKMTKLEDPLEKLKQESIKKAISYLPFINEKIKNSKDKLFTAIKAAVAGNVIDFAIEREFSLDDEINTIFTTDFAVNDYRIFKVA